MPGFGFDGALAFEMAGFFAAGLKSMSEPSEIFALPKVSFTLSKYVSDEPVSLHWRHFQSHRGLRFGLRLDGSLDGSEVV